jgi:hypothetical protein
VTTFAAVTQIDNLAATYHTIGDYSAGVRTLSGLETGATYEAWVTAANSAGWHSAYSPPVRFTVSSGVDSDGDGMPDDWETTYQISLGSSDADRDGLSNLDEYRNGTHPWEPDSDGDGFSDGEEVISNTNPLSASFYPAAFTQPRPETGTQPRKLLLQAGRELIRPFQDVNFYNDGGGTLDLSVDRNRAVAERQRGQPASAKTTYACLPMPCCSRPASTIPSCASTRPAALHRWATVHPRARVHAPRR